MKTQMYNELFDSLRGEADSSDYPLYLLINETVKKIAIDNHLQLPDFWKRVLSEGGSSNGLANALNQYEQKNLAQFIKSLNSFDDKLVEKLTDFSLRTRDAALLDGKEFLGIYEEFLSSRRFFSDISVLGVPTELFKLMHLLADTQNASSVYDGVLSQVNNLISAHLLNPEAELYAETPSQKEKVIAEMVSFLYLGGRAHIKQGDALRHPGFTKSEYELTQFESVVTAPPIGYQEKSNYIENDRFGRFIYGSAGHRDSAWGHIAHTIASIMNERGRGCVMIPVAPLFRVGKEEEIRRELLERDLIEGVIQLPAFILLKSGIAPFLMVLNKNKLPNDKGKIKMLDASGIFTQEGRRKVLDENDVEKIISIFVEAGIDESVYTKVDVHEVIRNSSNLVPEKYFLQKDIEIPGLGKVQIDQGAWESKETISIEDLTSGITNGANIKPDEEGRNVKTIKASDIQDGELLLEQIEEQPVDWKKSYERAIVRTGDLLMLSKGNNVKMAVMPEAEGEFIASVNLMIIRPKENVNPYFLQLYLESPFGQLELERIKAGGVIATWPLKEFRKIPIPLLNKEAQDEAAERYLFSKRKYAEALERAKEEKESTQLKIYEQLGLLEVINKNNK